MGLLAIGAYTACLAVIRGQARIMPLEQVPYVPAMLWMIGISIAASIVLGIIVGTVTSTRDREKDLRDRHIYQFGEYVGHSLLVVGAVAALAFAMLEVNPFWIANVIYLGFTLSATVAAIAKIVVYRRGLSW